MARSPLDKTSLPIAVVGVDFRRAPAKQRERILLRDPERLDLAHQLARSEIADGLACLDTCNRTEWIVSGPEPAWAAEVLRSQMIARDQDGSSHGGGALVPYVFVQREAARHLLQVAAGLDSFIMGEHEIASQLHKALARAREEQTSSPVLNGLGKVVGRLTRDTHQLNLTGSGPRGVHDLAVTYALRARDPLRRALVVGLGQIGEKVVRSLRRSGIEPVLCNRTRPVPWTGGTPVLPMEALADALSEVDVAFVCTAAPEHVITEALLTPREMPPPVLLLDLGIPSQVQPSLRPTLAELADLETLQRTRGQRQVASWTEVSHVQKRVSQAVAEFEAFCQERFVTDVLRLTQERHERYVQREIPELLDAVVPNLPTGDRAHLESELKGLVRAYTNAVFRDVKNLVPAQDD